MNLLSGIEQEFDGVSAKLNRMTKEGNEGGNMRRELLLG